MSTESDIWAATMHNIATTGSKALSNISISVSSSNHCDTGFLIIFEGGYILQVYDKNTVLAAQAIGDIAVLLN